MAIHLRVIFLTVWLSRKSDKQQISLGLVAAKRITTFLAVVTYIFMAVLNYKSSIFFLAALNHVENCDFLGRQSPRKLISTNFKIIAAINKILPPFQVINPTTTELILRGGGLLLIETGKVGGCLR